MMKKSMKPVALILTVMLLLGTVLTGCGGGNSIAGKWKFSGIKMGTITMDAKDIASMAKQYGNTDYDENTIQTLDKIFFDIQENGTFTAELEGQVTSGVWSASQDGYSFSTENGMAFTAVLEGGKLMVDANGNGTLILSK